ncbi:MAG: Zn-dependent hydrolase [Flavobacteriales bacterium]|nr:Zn-dependent hydrolase [Flavobacteriales bacterium]
MRITSFHSYLLSVLFILFGCDTTTDIQDQAETKKDEKQEHTRSTYAQIPLKTDISLLSDNEKKVIPLLIEAAMHMDSIFWLQSYGDRTELMKRIDNETDRKFADINYGPWDRLDGNRPFIEGVGEKPAGAGFYPTDMTKAQFDSLKADDKKSLYTVVTYGDGELMTLPYHKAYSRNTEAAALLLDMAAAQTDDEEFGDYLGKRAKSLRTDDYDPSDIAWLNMKNNHLDIIIGPIENYEDKLFGYKAAHEAYVLVKDMDWSERLAHYVQFLPELQEGLPVPSEYKQESPGTDSQLNAYDVIYYAGDCNSGSKTIAVNLPNDEKIQTTKGTRRSQLKNAMQAKYDAILVPLSDILIAEDQRKHITFDAFFANTMFHEVAHGLGIKNTINGKGTVREALKADFSALEEGKADILGLFMVNELFSKGEIKEGVLQDYYVTFLASIFRSVRFGASSAHGKANMLRFNFFKEKGAFARDSESNTYSVDMAKMKTAMNELCALILKIQGDGDLDALKALMSEKGAVGDDLQADLDRLNEAGIPVDVVFDQGIDILDLSTGMP